MRTQLKAFVLLAAVAAGGPCLGQDASTSDFQVLLTVSPAAPAPNGAADIEVASGGSIAMTITGGSSWNIYGAVYVSPANFPGDFLFQPEGLLFLGPLDATRSLSANVAIPSYLSGALVSAVAFVSDGVQIDASSTVTALIL